MREEDSTMPSAAGRRRSRVAGRALLSPCVPMLLFAATMPLWRYQSTLSSLRTGLMVSTIPTIQHMENESLEMSGNEATFNHSVSRQPMEKTALSNVITSTTTILASTNETSPIRREAVNVLYGLSGNSKSFLAEFETSLKSVLLNAPLYMDLNVFVLADAKSYSKIADIFRRAKLHGSAWGTQINIHAYDVSPHVNKWKETVSKLYQKKIGRVTRHTIGAYFRLFSNEILPKNVTHVVYMDTDVVVMSNLGNLWERINRNATYQWGKDHCSGFVVFNVPKIPTIWKMAQEYNFEKYASGDQFILKQVGKLHPEVVSFLPSEWAISVANGGLWRHAKNIVEYRSKVGMFHFNGQGARKASWWKNKNGLPYKYDTTFGNALYYVNLPWTWARFNGESQAAGGKKYKLIIHHDKLNGKYKSEKKNETNTTKPEIGSTNATDTAKVS